MRTKLLAVTAIVLAGCAHATGASPAPSASASAAATASSAASSAADASILAGLQTADRDFIAAWNGHDPNSIGAYFTDDARVTVSEDVYQGRADIVTRWITPTLQPMSNLAAIPAGYTTAGGRTTETGHYTMSVQGQAMGGSYTFVWARQPDGSWRIVSGTIGEAQPQ